MAKDPCKYKLPGSDTWMSELEFKQALSDGLLDQLMIESGLSVPSLKGFSPDSNKAESYKLGRGKGQKMTEDAELKAGSPEANEDLPPVDELDQAKQVEKLSNTILDIAKKSPARITAEGKIQGGMINLMSNVQKADAKPNISTPSTIPFLPQTITLKHLARSVNDLNSILKNGFDSDKVSIDSPIPGVYFSSEDWSTMDRFGRESDNSLFVDIDNKDLLYFDTPSDFTP